MRIKRLSVARLMLAMGIKMPIHRDFSITNESEFWLAFWLHERAKPFFCKSINARVRPVYLGPGRMTVEILAMGAPNRSPENPS
jgi:hypothetical protein